MSFFTGTLHRTFPILGLVALASCSASETIGPEVLGVEAAISSVTLANDCASDGEGGLRRSEDAACADGFAGCGWCRQTGIQVAIAADIGGDTAVPFEVVEISLHTMDGVHVAKLDPRNARVFADDTYVAWNETIAPGATLRVSYDTSSPDWAALGGGDAWRTYGMSFRVAMVVRIDGVARTLHFSPASREPEIVT